jgi:hypothetical protein
MRRGNQLEPGSNGCVIPAPLARCARSSRSPGISIVILRGADIIQIIPPPPRYNLLMAIERDESDLRPASFDEEESADLRRAYIRQGIRLLAAFVFLIVFVYTVFRWSGAAVRFGASRAASRGTPNWQIRGVVRNAQTHAPVAWAVVEDDPSGQPPFFHTQADQFGSYDLLTLAEPHRLRISAPGYQPAIVRVGRTWFLWLPHGDERRDVELNQE